jgi:hypothetical protein
VDTNNNNHAICTLTATTAVVTYSSTAGSLATNLITMSGSSLSVGAQTTINAVGGLDSIASALSSTTLLVYYRQASSNFQMNVLTVSGTSISAGATTSVNGTNNGLGLVGLNSTTALIAYNGTSSASAIQVVTISGTTPTPSTTLASNFRINNNSIQLCAISPTSVLAVSIFPGTSTTSSYAQAQLITVSGTSLSQSLVSQSYMATFNNNPRVIMVSATRGFIVNSITVMPFSINNGVFTFGNLLSGSFGYAIAAPLGTFVIGSLPTGAYKLATAGNYPATNLLGTNQIFTIGASN